MGLVERASNRAAFRRDQGRECAELVTLGFDPAGTPGDVFAREISAELKQWSDVAQTAGIKF